MFRFFQSNFEGTNLRLSRGEVDHVTTTSKQKNRGNGGSYIIENGGSGGNFSNQGNQGNRFLDNRGIIRKCKLR